MEFRYSCSGRVSVLASFGNYQTSKLPSCHFMLKICWRLNIWNESCSMFLGVFFPISPSHSKDLLVFENLQHQWTEWNTHPTRSCSPLVLCSFHRRSSEAGGKMSQLHAPALSWFGFFLLFFAKCRASCVIKCKIWFDLIHQCKYWMSSYNKKPNLILAASLCTERK